MVRHQHALAEDAVDAAVQREQHGAVEEKRLAHELLALGRGQDNLAQQARAHWRADP